MTIDEDDENEFMPVPRKRMGRPPGRKGLPPMSITSALTPLGEELKGRAWTEEEKEARRNRDARVLDEKKKLDSRLKNARTPEEAAIARKLRDERTARDRALRKEKAAAARREKKGIRPAGPILTRHLRSLAEEVCSVDDSGNPVTRALKLAMVLWDRALGYSERDPDNPRLIRTVAPQPWAITLVYDRIEGRAPAAVPENQKGTVAQRVTELGLSRINAFADAVRAIPQPPALVDRSGDGDQGSEDSGEES